MQKPKSQGRKQNQADASMKEHSLERIQVGSQVVECVQVQVEELVKKIENGNEEEEGESQVGEKRRREPGSTPEEQKRASKISMSKFGGGSKIALPTKATSLTM